MTIPIHQIKFEVVFIDTMINKVKYFSVILNFFGFFFDGWANSFILLQTLFKEKTTSLQKKH